MVFSKCLDEIEENAPKHQTKSSSQAKCTKSTSFFTCVRKKVDLVRLACEDEIKVLNIHKSNIIVYQRIPSNSFYRESNVLLK